MTHKLVDGYDGISELTDIFLRELNAYAQEALASPKRWRERAMFGRIIDKLVDGIPREFAVIHYWSRDNICYDVPYKPEKNFEEMNNIMLGLNKDFESDPTWYKTLYEKIEERIKK